MSSPPKSRKRGRYHHGDLPRALVEAAVHLVDEQGASALTLREVARRVDVTHAAPYRHFKDKSALLAAVAAAGFQRLTRALVGARDAAPADGQLCAMGMAYLRFAIERPAHYQLMFGAAAAGAGSAGLRAAAAELLAEVRRSSSSPLPERSDRTAASAWAEWHGLALLYLGGWLEPPAALPQPELLTRALRAARSPARRSARDSLAAAPRGAETTGTAPLPATEPGGPKKDPGGPSATAPDGAAGRTSFDR